MRYDRAFERTRFSTEVIEDAIKVFADLSQTDTSDLDLKTMAVTTDRGYWMFDSLDEYLSEHRSPHKSSDLWVWTPDMGSFLHVQELDIKEMKLSTEVGITLPDRAHIMRLAGVFERRASEFAVPATPDPQPRVFIGHGRSGQWRDLKDHLHEQHGYLVEAYETGARAGHVIRDILEEMLDASSFAVLVHTGEDETLDGSKRARQNVIHETGLFQGRLGFGRAIVLLEDGVEGYSNLQGVHQIQYSAGNIKETFGDVLATLRREFS